jgi:hypothetical protein
MSRQVRGFYWRNQLHRALAGVLLLYKYSPTTHHIFLCCIDIVRRPSIVNQHWVVKCKYSVPTVEQTRTSTTPCSTVIRTQILRLFSHN